MSLRRLPEHHQTWLIGTGPIARVYANILEALNIQFTVVGRDREKTRKFANDYSSPYFYGGLITAIEKNVPPPQFGIIATDIPSLAPCARLLVDFGVENILVEKPFSLELLDFRRFESGQSKVFIALNRRFFPAVHELLQRIRLEGGIRHIHFEISERIHEVENNNFNLMAKSKWGIANSLHVIDLAVMLTNGVKNLVPFSAGETSWGHASLFAGSGECSGSTGLVTYYGNWEGQGRWNISVETMCNRYELLPLEQLYVKTRDYQEREQVKLDTRSDFKPGFYDQIQSFFFNQDDSRLCSVESGELSVELAYQIFDYEPR